MAPVTAELSHARREGLLHTEQIHREAAHAWQYQLTDTHREQFLEKFGGVTLPDLLRLKDKSWLNFWRDELDQEEVIAVEVMLTGTLPSGEPFTGRVDEIVRRKDSGMIVLRDYKTTKVLPAIADPVDDLFDSQLHIYAKFWQPASGLRVNAVSYDRTRSLPEATPTLTASGELSKSSTIFSAETYKAWAESSPVWGNPAEVFKTGPRAGQPKGGAYELEPELLERLNSPAWRANFHTRTLVPVNRHVIAAHLAQLDATAVEAAKLAQAGDDGPPISRTMTRIGCKFCPYQDLCASELYGGRYSGVSVSAFGLKIEKN